MYNCELCSRTTKPRVPQHRVVVARRLKASGGWEIAKELAVCPPCEKSLEKEAEVANHA